ncbi:hypothetical protein HDF19_00600 [Mucilaginibacter sp. E4BP6]|uniref:hypothetical protein n=1 Tax=Mucilaginibacter sp. E4BP6 TaxID=2723089 RepID=UPI0015CAEE31|nr:hypothetical protein [Mucilaginibacter sp. E4BP6]NYE66921.1 hypothetical protein [Mucilaginibacter sp. E4BP6]
MASNRDNFSNSTKVILAQRVAYRCSSPGCPNITIGPHQSNPEKSMNVGEAAHIHAASPGGARYLETMKAEERSSPDNGIWLCKKHARAVDLDVQTYPAELLKSWKKTAEGKAIREMMNVEQEIENGLETLICLDVDLMFTGTWIGVKNDAWTFVVKDFLFGNVERLRSHGKNEILPCRRYIIIESQNEGRLLKEELDWRVNSNGLHEITVWVYPGAPKISLEALGSDMASSYDGDLVIGDGDFKMVSGAALAKQVIERNLGWPFGSWIVKPMMGSYFPIYYQAFKDNVPLLNRLTRIELLRLMNIPTSLRETDSDTPLNFIKSITEVSVLSPFNGLVTIFLSLVWSDGKAWSDTLYVNCTKDETVIDEEDTALYNFIKQAFDKPPGQLLQKAANIFKSGELQIKRSNVVIQRLFNESLSAIMVAAGPALESKIYPLFASYEKSTSIDRQAFGFYTTADIEMAVQKRKVFEIGLHLILRGFKKAGTGAFDIYGNLNIFFDDYYYAISPSHQSPHWLKKLYHTELGPIDHAAIAAQWVDHLEALIKNQIRQLH